MGSQTSGHSSLSTRKMLFPIATLLLALLAFTDARQTSLNRRTASRIIADDPVLSRGLKETNARRMARGLAPLKPKSLWSPAKTKARRADPSGGPVSTTVSSGTLYAVQPTSLKKRDVTTGCMISDGTWFVGGEFCFTSFRPTV